MARAAEDPKAFTSRIRDNLGSVVFVILPAFAFAVGLAYGRQRRHYPQHLVFALHVHAVVFLGFTVAELARFTGRRSMAGTVEAVVAVALAAYIVMALRRVYGGSIPRTLAKALALGLVYLCFFGAGMAVLALYGFYTS